MLTHVKDIGHIYATENSRNREHFGLYLCSGCNRTHRVRTSTFKSGYVNWCKECGIKNRRKKDEQIKKIESR